LVDPLDLPGCHAEALGGQRVVVFVHPQHCPLAAIVRPFEVPRLDTVVAIITPVAEAVVVDDEGTALTKVDGKSK
jgi:hypothetical protein